ncbi:hypothetical protein BDV25DRAFT_144689 [Aspergillus avenaceus]|uniref:Uncharacterized protein n=1 Tax=Aspergillus avenaceus TaxID=36643 RepID=A0A5N6TGA1_ASPAV|nr:hypothetical protein BDV25DRAFT_144689 [Aspergillus avenaceus]
MTFTPDSEFSSLETPRISTGHLSITALCRFEFEPGKGNEGTKILMLEWEDDDLSRSAEAGTWRVRWEGKQGLSVCDSTASDGHDESNENIRRVYFLLPPSVTIPPVVTLSYEPNGDCAVSVPRHDLHLHPLPAIFPPELLAEGRAAGKGVLHTIWAKRRLQELEREIREESRNVEGVALHMAIREKEWIELNFGVGCASGSGSGSGSGSLDKAEQRSTERYPMGPTTPVSPSTGGKLGEKLKGLRLQTSPRELSGRLLSPQSPDMAVFQPRTVAHYPPAMQSVEGTGFTSIAGPGLGPGPQTNEGEDLFAKALSPRSPDLPRSPFSFAPERVW